MLTPAQLENCKQAIRVIEATPEDSINLDDFTSKCGTLHCTAGWLALDPYFNKLGLKLVGGMVAIEGTHAIRGLEILFGPLAWDRLFPRRISGMDDIELLKKAPAYLTHKQLALARLRKHIDVNS